MPGPAARRLLRLALAVAAAARGRCPRASPKLVLYNRLPWFDGEALDASLRNHTVSRGAAFLYTGPDGDAFTSRDWLGGADVGRSRGGAGGAKRLLKELRAWARPRRAASDAAQAAPAVMIKSVAFTTVDAKDLAWINFVEDPVARRRAKLPELLDVSRRDAEPRAAERRIRERRRGGKRGGRRTSRPGPFPVSPLDLVPLQARAVRAYRGTADELAACVRARGARACVPCETLTAWFCGGGARCSTARDGGPAALVRAKQVLTRDFAFVGVRERAHESLLVLGRVLPAAFGSFAKADAAAALAAAPPRGATNVSAVDARTLRLIRNANSLDAALYAHAAAHLDAALRDCVGGDDAAARRAAARGSPAARSASPAAPAAGEEARRPTGAAASAAGGCVEPADGAAGGAASAAGAVDSPRRCVPSPVIVGSRSVGAGVVAAVLASHPRLGAPASGETFEASYEYSIRPQLLENVRSALPGTFVIFVVQEPVQRASDEFCGHARRGRVLQRGGAVYVCYGGASGGAACGGGGGSGDGRRAGGSGDGRFAVGDAVAAGPAAFDEYVRQVAFSAWEPSRQDRAGLNDSLPLGFELGKVNANVLAKSLYSAQLKSVFETFGAERTHVVVHEHLVSRDRGSETAAAMFRFLGLPEVDLTAARIAQFARRSVVRRRVRRQKRTPAAEKRPRRADAPSGGTTKRFLDAFFAVDTQLLRKMAPGADVPWGK
ncbi:hypothetical protein M885DRAFT_591621 [Pelagophyceae sp. CCMP2097]|nr:hypothetical protein M885DRAFT_591621 [Pelagophyceae sp. CCMP2097]